MWGGLSGKEHRPTQGNGRPGDREQANPARYRHRSLERGAADMQSGLDDEEAAARLQTGAHFGQERRLIGHLVQHPERQGEVRRFIQPQGRPSPPGAA